MATEDFLKDKIDTNTVLGAEVRPAPQYIKRIKHEVLFDIEGWQAAEPDSKDEKEWEKRLRESVGRLQDWKETRHFVEESKTVCELQHKLREDLGLSYKDAKLELE